MASSISSAFAVAFPRALFSKEEHLKLSHSATRYLVVPVKNIARLKSTRLSQDIHT